MIFKRLGYDFTEDCDIECFDNVVLVYSPDEGLYWITIPDSVFENEDKMEENFYNDEVFILSFSLEKRKGYKLKFSTQIKYRYILQDLIDNKIDDKVKINFDKETYLINKKFYVVGGDKFETTVERLRDKLKKFNVSRA